MSNQPKLKRDWIGRTVRLKRRMTTNGGKIFDAGAELLVTGYYKGLQLKKPEICEHCHCGISHEIWRVSITEVELLPEAKS